MSSELNRDGLIQKILDLQQHLSELTLKVDAVRNENLQLKEENEVLREYIENLVGWP